MDVQNQDSVLASEKEQLSAPPGWTKKLVPASAKSITLRKHDVIFIAPDGQEVKSKWHLSRYLKAHPNGPAPSEFNWSSGEEAPIRRSSRVVAATKEDSVVEKSSTRKKNKRNASEMDSEEAESHKEESHKEKPQARKRAKKSGKSTDLDDGAQDPADVPEEAVDEGTVCDNEATQDASPLGEGQKLEKEASEAEEASKEDVTENVAEVEASKEDVTENVVEVEASSEDVTEKVMDEVLDLLGEAVIPDAIPDGEVYVSEVTVVEVKEVITEREVHAENEENTVQETGALLDSLGELNGEQAAMEFEQPAEHIDGDDVMETQQPMEKDDGNITELEENLEPKSEVNEEVVTKVSMVSSVTVASSVVEDDTPSDPLKHEEEPLGPLVQKEEQERPVTQVEIKERSPSEFNGSSVPVNVSNQ